MCQVPNLCGKTPTMIQATKVSFNKHASLRIFGFQSLFELETDASLKKFWEVLSERNEHDCRRVIAYANHSLRPNECSVHNCSSFNLE